ALARRIREELPGIRLILGGSYLTAVAADVPRIPTALLPADAIVLFDGEEALDAWLEVVVRGRGRAEDVPNVFLPRDGTFQRAGSGPPTHTDLGSLPVPMWTGRGLELERYLVPRYAVGLPLTRGCHWGRCAYCNISSQTAARYRRREPAQAVADLGAIVAETGTSWFDFPVDSYHPRDLAELARAILAAGLEVEWAAEVLLDPGFTEAVIAELARAGCRCLRFGLESADPATLKAMRKPTRPEVAAEVLGRCRRHGVRTGVMVIAGFPTETQAALGRTYDFLVEHRDRIDFVGIHPFSLVPGSAMAQDPGRFGLYLRPRGAVLTTSLPFASTHPVGMQNEDLPRVIDAMKAGLREHYPDLGELWTAAIGGWMTFPSCCAGPR
ncbi:MAG TPA: B12-binding domain-containing radical SAM protein, partial [Polyangiaceae bacterium]|nr:B12-binding domain-containing radical SAM protein [Polyangiaceae bacterium]